MSVNKLIVLLFSYTNEPEITVVLYSLTCVLNDLYCLLYSLILVFSSCGTRILPFGSSVSVSGLSIRAFSAGVNLFPISAFKNALLTSGFLSAVGSVTGVPSSPCNSSSIFSISSACLICSFRAFASSVFAFASSNFPSLDNCFASATSAANFCLNSLKFMIKSS